MPYDDKPTITTMEASAVFEALGPAQGMTSGVRNPGSDPESVLMPAGRGGGPNSRFGRR